jgi:hypothetical protein
LRANAAVRFSKTQKNAFAETIVRAHEILRIENRRMN